MPQDRSHMISAFTLTEVMITMVVSSLVILLAYSALQMMNHYFLRTGLDNEINGERLGMRTVMAGDVDGSDSIHHKGGLLLIYKEGKIIKWKSDGTTLTRGVEDDTKVFRPGNNVIFSNGLPSGLTGMVGIGLVDETGDSTFFRFFKDYGLAVEVNRSATGQDQGDDGM